ncbi:MAG: acyl-CoA thioesterase [Polyangiaceae bacterium]|nr:acyl-CoA thioesterase [Polyangiaceae bacterium]MCW5790524.1 acyl-CoA thioesterase [Polyangiaceae bacterium]
MKVPETPLTPDAETRASLRVRFGETDLMGIVHHAAYLSYFELARVEYLRRRGVIYARWAEGRHLPVVSAGLEYLRSARFDDELQVVARLAVLTRVRVGFSYQVLRGEELLCRGDTMLCCVDDAGRPRRIPDDLTQALLGPEQG